MAVQKRSKCKSEKYALNLGLRSSQKSRRYDMGTEARSLFTSVRQKKAKRHHTEKNRAKTSDLSPLETKCDIFYEDYSKRRFTTQATLSHNIVRGLTVAKNYSFYELQLAKPQSRFRKRLKLRCLC